MPPKRLDGVQVNQSRPVKLESILAFQYPKQGYQVQLRQAGDILLAQLFLKGDTIMPLLLLATMFMFTQEKKCFWTREDSPQ